MKQKLLTGLELKVMNLLWDKKKAFVKELILDWGEEPKPAYNTVSTVVRILQDKKYIGHESFGRSHQYHPLVTREAYQKRLVKNVLQNVFAGSVTSMISTLVDTEEITNQEIEDLRNMIDDHQE